MTRLYSPNVLIIPHMDSYTYLYLLAFQLLHN